MHSQLQKLTTPIFTYFPNNSMLGKLKYSRNPIKIPQYTEITVEFLPYTELAQNSNVFIESEIRSPETIAVDCICFKVLF